METNLGRRLLIPVQHLWLPSCLGLSSMTIRRNPIVILLNLFEGTLEQGINKENWFHSIFQCFVMTSMLLFFFGVFQGQRRPRLELMILGLEQAIYFYTQAQCNEEQSDNLGSFMGLSKVG